MNLEDATDIFRSLLNTGVIEILILCGEVHPQSPRRQAWFERIYHLCELALSWGFLPHTNAGPLSFAEMAQLKAVNVSMGLMLEQINPDLAVHRHAPSKVPRLRQQQLEWAGELKIPFTTGLLLGIGETPVDWRDTLLAIAQSHQRWGHIQEVIVQPHSSGSQQSFRGDGFQLDCLAQGVRLARTILPPEISIQIPPNLVLNPEILLACLDAGATDLGGIGPRDEVNPDYPHPQHRALLDILQPCGWQLVQRLPVYPQYDPWLGDRLQVPVRQWRSKLSGL